MCACFSRDGENLISYGAYFICSKTGLKKKLSFVGGKCSVQ